MVRWRVFLQVNFPSINAITGVGYLFSSEQLKAKFLRWALSPVLRFLWRRAGTVMLFQNPDDRAVFIKRGLSAENAPLIPGSGVDDDKFKPVATKSSLGKNNRPLVIGCASRLLRDKGIPELIEAVKIVEKNYHIELQVAGDIFLKNPVQLHTAGHRKMVENLVSEVFGQRLGYGGFLAGL